MQFKTAEIYTISKILRQLLDNFPIDNNGEVTF